MAALYTLKSANISECELGLVERVVGVRSQEPLAPVAVGKSGLGFNDILVIARFAQA